MKYLTFIYHTKIIYQSNYQRVIFVVDGVVDGGRCAIYKGKCVVDGGRWW
jgi:hypothetical protein